jgi:hypothetical protein
MTTKTLRARVVLLSCVLALVALAVGCGSSTSAGGPPTAAPTPATCDPIYEALQLRPSDIQALEQAHKCLEQDLTLSGEVTSHVAIALLQQPTLCARPNKGDLAHAFTLDFTQGSQLYHLAIQPGTPNDGSAHDVQISRSADFRTDLSTVDQQSGHESRWRQQSGSLHVSADTASGTIDAVLARDEAGAGQTHMTGSWACA